jgi:uncharacterized lipoprotein YmbA
MDRRTAALFVAGFFLLVCTGCARTAPTHFYLLQPLSGQETQARTPDRHVFGIGPVDIADYLKRQQIANRIDENEILFSDFNSWAEPLDRCVTRVLSENLSVLLNTERIEVYPWLPSLSVDYQVRMRIARFDGTTDEEAVLVAYWSLYGRDDAMLADHKSVISEKIDAGGYAGLVQAQNRALEKLSREIAAALQKVAR